MTAIRYRNDMLVSIVEPFGVLHGPEFLFIHHNARPHIVNIKARAGCRLYHCFRVVNAKPRS